MEIDYKALAEKSRDELREWVKTEKPNFTEDERQEFVKFAGMGEEQRNEFLSERYPTGEGAEVTPEPTESDGQSSEPDTKPEPIDPEEKVKLLESMADSYKAQVDKLNASKGKQGEELKRLREELSNLKTEQPAESVDITLPEPPDPSKYDDGVYSDQYQTELRSYQTEVNKAYNQKIQELSQTVDELKSTATTTAEQYQADRQRNAQTLAEKRADDMWNTLETFRSDYGIEMQTELQKVNDIALRCQGPDKENALREYSELPESDRTAYDRICAVAHTMYQFDENGIPVDTRHKDIRAAALESGKFTIDDLIKEPVAEETPMVDIEAARRRQLQSEPNSLADQNAETNPGEGTEDSTRANRNRLLELAKMAQKDPRAFKQSKELVDEFNSLHGKLGVAKFIGPSKMRYDG